MKDATSGQPSTSPYPAEHAWAFHGRTTYVLIPGDDAGKAELLRKFQSLAVYIQENIGVHTGVTILCTESPQRPFMSLFRHDGYIGTSRPPGDIAQFLVASLRSPNPSQYDDPAEVTHRLFGHRDAGYYGVIAREVAQNAQLAKQRAQQQPHSARNRHRLNAESDVSDSRDEDSTASILSFS